MKKFILIILLFSCVSIIFAQEDIWQLPDTYTIMIYNLCHFSKNFNKHKYIINGVGADVVALQEMKKTSRFKDLKRETGMDGEFCIFPKPFWFEIITGGFVPNYGIVLLWKTSRVGAPTITKRIVDTPNDDNDFHKKAYMIAEFSDLCIICTHYSLNRNDNQTITNQILSENIVQRCKNTGKPVYIAGDFNGSLYATKIFTDSSNNFTVLNKTDKYPNTNIFVDATKKDGSMIDLIFEYNTNPNHQTLERGIPSSFSDNWLGEVKKDIFKQPYLYPKNDGVSDHRPYFVKVKIK